MGNLACAIKLEDEILTNTQHTRSLTVTGRWSWTGAGAAILLLVYSPNIPHTFQQDSLCSQHFYWSFIQGKVSFVHK